MTELDYWETDTIAFIDNEVSKIEREYGVNMSHPEHKGYMATFDAETFKQWKVVASGWCADLAAEFAMLSNTIKFLEEPTDE